MSGSVHLPAHLHTAAGRDGTLYVLDSRTGRWLVLNASGARLWRAVLETGDVEQGIDEVAIRYARSTAERFRVDARDVVSDMIANRLLAPGSASTRPREAAKGQPCGALLATGPEPGPWPALLAGSSLLFALLLLRLPFRHTARLVDMLTRVWCTRSIDQAEALSAVGAVEAVADRYPGRAACLERSLGAVLAAAIRRRRLSWVLGVAENPSRFHAWVEFDGRIVTRSADAQTAFIRVWSVGETGRQKRVGAPLGSPVQCLERQVAGQHQQDHHHDDDHRQHTACGPEELGPGAARGELDV